MAKNLYKIIILGSIWGMFEATAGYLLHLFGIHLGWMIWFPAAYFFIHKAYCHTQSIPSVMLTALIASSLKLLDLFFPGRIDMVINPAVSILLEALSVMLVYKYVMNQTASKVNPLMIWLAGLMWRSLYICYVLCLPQSLINIAPFTTMDSFLEFMFLNNVVNTVFISAGFLAAPGLKKPFHIISGRVTAVLKHKDAIQPALAATSLLLAILVQVTVR